MNFVTSNGITIHYKTEGNFEASNSSQPCLVFLNSLGTDFRIWDDVVSRFSEDYPILRYDKRGHGLSEAPPTPYSMTDHAEDLGGVLDYLNIENVVLIGVSVGGMIALELTRLNPTKIKALVLCDTGAKIGTETMWNDRVNTLRENGMAHLGDAIVSRFFAPSFAEEQPVAYQGYKNMLVRTNLTGYTGTCEALRDADLRTAVRTIEQPTLVLNGSEDMATPPSLGQELAEAMPNASFELIDGAAHLPCIEKPIDVSNKIQTFLKGLS